MTTSFAIDSSGHGHYRWSLFSHMVSVRTSVVTYTYVTKIKTRYNTNFEARKAKTIDTMPEYNNHLLTGAWWVTLKSLDLLLNFIYAICLLSK